MQAHGTAAWCPRRRRPGSFARVASAAAALAAVWVLAALPAGASGQVLDPEAASDVVRNTWIADAWSCHPVTSRRVDCERDALVQGEDDDFDRCHDLVAFFLNRGTLDWRFYEHGCRTGFALRPHWAAALRPVPFPLLFSHWEIGHTAEGRPISVDVVRQFEDNGDLSEGEADEVVATVRLSCDDSTARQRTYERSLNGSGFSAATRRVRAGIDRGRLHLVLRGHVTGHAWTGVVGTLRVSQTLRNGVRCRSGGVRFAAAARRIDVP